ncbi:hypothetical protein [Pseudoduganella armeniaca]|uniref:VWFA domain-containing protein n=1 Tax=Pseudoduganella armeniaca TaxID=2072590 RepID=A0A2R4CDZ7_9BURK|nr:hypothetical protein [Pseudoduganella armeniaca]AVR97845.1 hypothetical protein C9I28_21055 [Pseudoduganella armeniaca]
MKSTDLVQHALTLLRQAHPEQELLLVHAAELTDPASGITLHEFRVVAAADPNGLSWSLVLDADGTPRARPPALDPLALAAQPVRMAALPAITIQPDSNVLTLSPGDTVAETLVVTVPKHAGAARADVYFLADTTGSMGPVLAAVQAGANNVLAALGSLGLDLAFGVGNYKDFVGEGGAPFTHQLAPTGVAPDVTAAIGAWSASGGGDVAEAQFAALGQLAQAPGGGIGWRAGTRRIVVWIGDAPGHDPICTVLSGLASDITEAGTSAALAAQQIAVLAISTAQPGLDADPLPYSGDYAAPCGAVGGSAGQASRIAAATGGKFVAGIVPATIVATIVDLVKGAVAGIGNVRLVPSAAVAPFVASITPAVGYGPLAGERQHVLTFELRLRGIDCKAEAQHVTGTLDVVADGVAVAAKRMAITVPPCRPKAVSYSVKFVCGLQPEACGCTPVRPGRYATQISIHNQSSEAVTVRKRLIPLVLGGAPLGREPGFGISRAEDSIELPPHTATLDDCGRIAELLFGAAGSALTIGLMEITVPRDVSVTAIYTTDRAIDVMPIAGIQA